jgi:ANTAR domain
MDPASALAETVARLRAVAASGRPAADDQQRRLIDRAAGLLAGRVGCGLDHAAGHLVRLAQEQGRALVDVAAVAVDALTSSAPDSSAPDSSAPDSSAPGSSAPGLSAPDSGAVVLVLCTDGLIERPGGSVEAGVRQVSQARDDASGERRGAAARRAAEPVEPGEPQRRHVYRGRPAVPVAAR